MWRRQMTRAKVPSECGPDCFQSHWRCPDRTLRKTVKGEAEGEACTTEKWWEAHTHFFMLKIEFTNFWVRLQNICRRSNVEWNSDIKATQAPSLLWRNGRLGMAISASWEPAQSLESEGTNLSFNGLTCETCPQPWLSCYDTIHTDASDMYWMLI